VSNSSPSLDQPDTEMISSKASEIYWKVKSVQLSCELDFSLPLVLPPLMEHNIGQHIQAVAQSFLLIPSLDSNTTVLMPSSHVEEAPFDVPVEDNPPRIQEAKSKGEQGPILPRSASKQ
jgi:hypothetical protein